MLPALELRTVKFEQFLELFYFFLSLLVFVNEEWLEVRLVEHLEKGNPFVLLFCFLFQEAYLDLLLVFLFRLSEALDASDQFGHGCTQYNGGDEDHDQNRAFDDVDFLAFL